jgi:uncharacterized protein
MTTRSLLTFTTKFIAAIALFYCGSSTLHAQTADAKRALAARVIAAQEGPEMDALLSQLAGSATQQLIATWNERVLSLPEAKQQAAITALDPELKKFTDETYRSVTAQASKVRKNELITAYTERFSEPELKQLAALMEAPAFKKYQTTAPELGNVFIKSIIDATRADVEARSKAFDTTAAQIVGSSPAPKK